MQIPAKSSSWGRHGDGQQEQHQRLHRQQQRACLPVTVQRSSGQKHSRNWDQNHGLAHESGQHSRDTGRKKAKILPAESTIALRQIEEQLRQHAVVFVSGDTGSGKTTQAPWHLAKSFSKKPVACCLPRRLQARSAAKYVRKNAAQSEQGDIGWTVGGEKGESGRQLTYFTHGCFLQQRWDTLGQRFGIVIVDEAHEQSMETQILFWILQQALKNHCPVKVVIMSATMDVTQFQMYFERVRVSFASTAIELGPRQHPVDVITLEHIGERFPASRKLGELCAQTQDRMKNGEVPDWTRREMHCMLGELVACTMQPGRSVLVFLPGLAEIMDVASYLRKNVQTAAVHVLHSVIAKEDQNVACSEVPLHERRVILATSVAESSVTIVDLACVIDTGITRDTESADLFGLSVLCDGWSPETVVKQRMGRVGRTDPGMNIRLFSEHVATEHMPKWRYPQWTVASVAHAALLIKLHLDSQQARDVTVEVILSQLLVAPGSGLAKTALEQLCSGGFMRPCSVQEGLPLHAAGALARRGSEQPASPKPSEGQSTMSLEITACGRFSIALPADLRCGRLITISLALNELLAGVLMATALVIGDPFRRYAVKDELDDARMLQELERMCETRQKFGRQANSDLIAVVNMYLHSVTCAPEGLLKAGIGEHQAKTFRDEFLHLAERVLTYIRQKCTSLNTVCVQLESAVNAMRHRRAIEDLTGKPEQVLLQVLAGAPCLICGHEVRNSFPPQCKPDREPEQGGWVFLGNITRQHQQTSSGHVIKTAGLWLQALGTRKAQELTVWDECRSVLWMAAPAEKPPQRTVQVLRQWGRRERLIVSTDGMMEWSTVFPRRHARLTQSLLDGLCNPCPQQKQCLAMCQSFRARRAIGSALKCVRSEGAQLLLPGFTSAAWILCSLWGQFQLRFWRDTQGGPPTAYELQGQGDHRPDVLAIPLCATALAEDDLLDIVNTCRKALNSFFRHMTLETQECVLKAFHSLETFAATCSILPPPKPFGDGPASFVGPAEWPKHRSDVVMPDTIAAWGFARLRRFKQQELDEIGSTAIVQVLEMLQKGEPMGIDTRLVRLLHACGGIAKAKYKVQWQEEGVQRKELPNDLQDKRGCVAASRHLLRIPLAPQCVRKGKCQDDETPEPQGQTDSQVKVFYHGTPLLSVPSILAFGLQASRRSHGYVGLWCRERLEHALSWCTCPEVQHFPCVALELAAWKEPHGEDTENGIILNNRKTCGAFCIQVKCGKGESATKQLPPVALRALWVAMPRSHVHFQLVSQLQNFYKSTIDWVAKETGADVHRRGRRNGEITGTLAGPLAQLTEHRLVY